MLSEEKRAWCASVDIAQELSVTKPSVSVAMKNLREDGYILMDKDSLITLTDKGMAIARNIYDRHKAFTLAFLVRLGVDEATAREDACRTEHDISARHPPKAICRALQETP